MKTVKKFIIWTVALVLVMNVSLLTSFKPERAKAAEPTSHVVISEVLVDSSGNESDYEFVELYNPTESLVNIAGWDIAYEGSAFSSWTAVASISTGAIAAHGFFLIGGNEVSPTPDLIDGSLGFAATGGHIAVRNDSDMVIDKLGYGTATNPEGVAAPAPSTDQSLERKPGFEHPSQGNGIDTDNNQGDFLLRIVSQPQNSSSSLEPTLEPEPISDLAAFDQPYDEGGALILKWNKSGDDGQGNNNVTGYAIYRKTEGGLYSIIDTIEKGLETYTDATATFGLNFHYKVETLNGGYSSFSNEIGPVTSADNLAPRIENLTPADGTLTNDPSSVSVVLASIVENGSGIESAILKFNGSLVDDYIDALLVYNPPLPLSDGNYLIEVEAIDKAGNSNNVIWWLTIDTQAEAPGGLTATATDGVVNLSWTKVQDANYYEIWRTSSEFSLIATVSGEQNSYTDSSVEKGKNYRYKIITVDKAGNKSTAASISITVPIVKITLIPKAEAAEVAPTPPEEIAPPAAAQEIQPPATEAGKILGEEEETPEARNWTPLIILISLIILFGAGYYGLRWYQKRTTSDRW